MPFALKLRRNSATPRLSLRERYAALKGSAAKVIRRPAPENTTNPAAEAGAILDALLVSRVQELVAIEAGQDATLRATSFADAYDSPDWVRMERARETFLAQVIGAPAHTMAGVRAKAIVLDLESVTHSREAFEGLSRSIEADIAALGLVPQRGQAPAPMASHTDPHVALLPALRQAFAWTRQAAAFADAPCNSPEERANLAVAGFCWRLADRIIALPAPTTTAGLGALALALSVVTESAIGLPQDDGHDGERYVDEKRMAAAVRAMMATAKVSPLPGWCGFGNEPDAVARWEAVKAQAGEGFLPAWALAGKSGPDEGAATSADAPGTAHIAEAPATPSPVLDLSGYSITQLCALFDVYERAEDQFHAASWWPNLGDAGGDLAAEEGDRCTALKNAVAAELQARSGEGERDADLRAEKLMRRALVTGDWEAIARLAGTLRDEAAAVEGKR